MGDPRDDVPAEVLRKPPNSAALGEILRGSRFGKYGRFVFAALGSVPWIGGLLGASAALHAENEQGRINELTHRWIEEHEEKAQKLSATLAEMSARLDQLGDDVEPRVQEESYLSLVRKGFRVWDEATTEEKRDYVRRTLTNAAATKICSDDVVRLFISWIDQYDETHFNVIRALYHNRGATRGLLWEQIGGVDVREDSAEADLFKLLIHDLSMGHVLRQIRDKDGYGNFLVRRRSRPQRKVTIESAFEDTKPYELTSLGEQFVAYAMNEAGPRIGESPSAH